MYNNAKDHDSFSFSSLNAISGNQLIKILAEKAQEGVEVRFSLMPWGPAACQ
jgi:hypothetical protein